MQTFWPRWTLITQNVDGLHQAAGSRQVAELHGSIWLVRCTACRHEVPNHRAALPDDPRCPKCGGLQRPGVVWFGELLAHEALRSALRALPASQGLLVVGTSAIVQPTGSMALGARSAGAYVVEVNVEDTAITANVDATLRGPSGKVLPQLLLAIQRLRPQATA